VFACNEGVIMKTVCRFLLVLTLSCLTSDSGDDSNDSGGSYTISGTTVDSAGNGISGASVTLTGDNRNLTVSSGSDGAFVFSDIENGSYTITPSKSGYTFQSIIPLYPELALPAKSLYVSSESFIQYHSTTQQNEEYNVSKKTTGS